MIQMPVSENGLIADLFLNDANTSGRAIVMLGGSEGGKMWSSRIWKRQVIGRLVERGYNVLSLAYFKAPGLPGALQQIPLEYFERAFAWLARQPAISSDKLALIGGSKGAELALLLGSRFPQVAAVIGLLPSCVVWQGIPGNRFKIEHAPKSSWTYAGLEIPYVPVSYSSKDLWSLLTLRLRGFHEAALQNRELVDAATIPVESIRGPILLLSGERDQLWPSTLMAERIVSRLAAGNFGYAYEHVAFDKGHGGVVRDRADWQKVFSFLDEHFD